MAAHIRRPPGNIPIHEIRIGAIVGIAIGGAVCLGLVVLAGIILILQWRHDRNVANVARHAITQRSVLGPRTSAKNQPSQSASTHRIDGKRSSWTQLSSNENLREAAKRTGPEWMPRIVRWKVAKTLACPSSTFPENLSSAADESTRLSAIYESYQTNPRLDHCDVIVTATGGGQSTVNMEEDSANPQSNNIWNRQCTGQNENPSITAPKPVHFSLYPSPYSSTHSKIRSMSLPSILAPEAEANIRHDAVAPPTILRHSRSRSFGCMSPGPAPLKALPQLPTLKKHHTIRKASMESTMSMNSTGNTSLHPYDIHQLGVTRPPAMQSSKLIPRKSHGLVNITSDCHDNLQQQSVSMPLFKPERPISRIRTIIGEDSKDGQKPNDLSLVPLPATCLVTSPGNTKTYQFVNETVLVPSSLPNIKVDFSWKPVSTKPSAMKGSPSARKGHQRQNCVRIELNPSVLGPLSRTSSGTPVFSIIEESPDSSSVKSFKSRNTTPDTTLPHQLASIQPPIASTFNPDIKLDRSPTQTSSHCEVYDEDKNATLHPRVEGHIIGDVAEATLTSNLSHTLMSSTVFPAPTKMNDEDTPSPKPRQLRPRRSASSSTLRFSESIDPEELIVDSSRSSMLIDGSELSVFVDQPKVPVIPGLTLLNLRTPRQQEFEWPTIQLQSSPPRTSMDFDTWSDVSCVPSPLTFTPKTTASVAVFPTNICLPNKASPTTKMSQSAFPIKDTAFSSVANRTNPFDTKPDFSPKYTIPAQRAAPIRSPRLNGPRDAPAQNLRKSVKYLRSMSSNSTLGDTREQRRYRYLGREASPDLNKENSPHESMISLGKSVWEEGENFWQQENVIAMESPLGLSVLHSRG